MFLERSRRNCAQSLLSVGLALSLLEEEDNSKLEVGCLLSLLEFNPDDVHIRQHQVEVQKTILLFVTEYYMEHAKGALFQSNLRAATTCYLLLNNGQEAQAAATV